MIILRILSQFYFPFYICLTHTHSLSLSHIFLFSSHLPPCMLFYLSVFTLNSELSIIFPFFLFFLFIYLFLFFRTQDLEGPEDWESDRKKMVLKKPYCLRVYVYQCRGLPAIDGNGLIDPYVKVRTYIQLE